MTVLPTTEVVARALCEMDFARIQEPDRSRYIEEQWRTYASRADAAISAYIKYLTKCLEEKMR